MAIPFSLKLRRWPYSLTQPIWRAGLPTTKAYAGTGLVITDPAPMRAYSPISLPQTIVAFAPTDAPRRSMVGLYSFLRATALRGFITLVKTIDGPRNTSSSHTTPVYTLTLFWIFTLRPNFTSGDMTTFCPILQFSPIVQFGIMCEKCHILVPFPIVQPSSTYADSCLK